MKCENAQESIALSVYGELADDQSHQLEQHLAGCAACRGEFDAVQALAKAMSLLPFEEPPANLVARSRMRLQEALDALPRSGWVQRFAQQFSRGFHGLTSTPVAASALLVAGLAGGGYGGYRAGAHVHAAVQSTAVQPSSYGSEPVQIAKVTSAAGPASENVQVDYYRMVPESIHGSLDDDNIRKLLVAGALNRANPDVRDNAVGLLARECRAGHQCGDGPMRTALEVSLLYDNTPGNRLAALEGLQPYVADDVRVRDAVLQALLSDPDARVRTQAISLLEPVQADSSVQNVLHTVASRDNSPQIRGVSQQALNRLDQIQ